MNGCSLNVCAKLKTQCLLNLYNLLQDHAICQSGDTIHPDLNQHILVASRLPALEPILFSCYSLRHLPQYVLRLALYIRLDLRGLSIGALADLWPYSDGLYLL